jgi:hypothetical protein
VTGPLTQRGIPGLPQNRVEFVVDDDLYVLPELPARAWLDALTLERPACWLQIVPTCLEGDGARDLSHRVVDDNDPMELDDLENVAEAVVARVCGMHVYAASALAVSAVHNWVLFDGWAVTVGLDPLAAPISRTLAAAYAWRRSLCQEKADLTRLDVEVWNSTPGLTVMGRPRDVQPIWKAEDEEAMLLGAMAALGGASPP